MEKLFMESKLEELFQEIQNSHEYQDYLNIGQVIEGDDEIHQLVDEIKLLQQKSVELEYSGDSSYLEIDQLIEEKVHLLNCKPIYQEYLRRMDQLNDILAESSHQIEEYIHRKI